VTARQRQTAIHEAGHAVAALCLDLRAVEMRLQSETMGYTDVQTDRTSAVRRLAEETYRSFCTTACGGNAAVRYVMSPEAAEAELVDQPKGAQIDAERATHWGRMVERSSGEPADTVVATAKAETDELFSKPEIREAVVRVADALLEAGGFLDEEAIRAAFDAVDV
jgi:hypothetical protein